MIRQLACSAVLAILSSSVCQAEENSHMHAGHDHSSTRNTHIEHGSRSFAAERLQPYDANVIDQNGSRLKFSGQVLGTNQVVITFVYSRCDTVCPLSNAIFGALQQQLDVAKDETTRLISISIDPEYDTPPRLLEMARAFGAGKRWSFVTGSRAEISTLLRSLGVQLGAVEEHDPMVLVGNLSTQSYFRVVGLPDPDQLLKLLHKSFEEAPS